MCVCVCVLVAKSCPNLCDSVDCSLPGSSIYGIFSRQEYWSGLLFPSPGDLPNPGIDPGSPTLQADFTVSAINLKVHWQKYERTYVCTRLYKAALFIRAKEWKQAQMFSDRELTE